MPFRSKALKVILTITVIALLLYLAYQHQINALVGKPHSSNQVTSLINEQWLEMPLEVNGSATFGLFDTGASVCVVDSASIDKYNVFCLPFKPVRVNNRSWHKLGIVSRLNVSGFTFRNVLVVVMDFKSKNTPLKCVQSDIILGTPVIRQLVWEFNFASGTATVANYQYPIDSVRFPTSIKIKGSLAPQVEVLVDGERHNLLVDMGYTSTLSIASPASLKNTAYGFSSSGHSNIFGSYSVEGNKSISTITIETDTIPDLIIDRTKGSLNLLGLDFFRQYNAIVYNPYQRVIHLGTRVERHKNQKLCNHGFSLGLINGIVQVNSIVKGSPAFDAGLRVGDRVVCINNEEVSQHWVNLDFCNFQQECANLFRNQTISIAVLRNDTVRHTITRGYY